MSHRFHPKRVSALKALPILAICGCVGIIAWWFLKAGGQDQPDNKSSVPGVAQNGARPGVPNPRPESPQSTSADPVQEWRQAAEKAAFHSVVPTGITVTSPQSPARRAAFEKMLAGLTPEKAAELYDLLTAEEGPATPTDAEWADFLESWGRADGPGAASHLAGRADEALRMPAVLYGWAATDPTTAAAWLEREDTASTLKNTPGAPAAAGRELIRGWAQADPDGAAHWLNARQDDPEYSEAAAIFAGAVAALDPEGALAWALSIQGFWRYAAIESVGRQWLMENPDEARQKFLGAGFSEEAIRALAVKEPPGFDLLSGSPPPTTGAEPLVLVSEEDGK